MPYYVMQSGIEKFKSFDEHEAITFAQRLARDTGDRLGIDVSSGHLGAGVYYHARIGPTAIRVELRQ
jgi:hypothetical protein